MVSRTECNAVNASLLFNLINNFLIFLTENLPILIPYLPPKFENLRPHSSNSTASFPVVLGDFGCDVTCQACRENSPIALGSKPPLVTRIARTGLGTRLVTLLKMRPHYGGFPTPPHPAPRALCNRTIPDEDL